MSLRLDVAHSRPGEPRHEHPYASRVRRRARRDVKLVLEGGLDVHQAHERVVAWVIWACEPLHGVRPYIDDRAVLQDNSPLRWRTGYQFHVLNAIART